MLIKLQEGGPIARLYRWSRKTWHSFGGSFDYGERRTDFCTVSRAILIQMPLAIAVNAVSIGFAAYSAFRLTWMFWLNAGPIGIVLLISAVAAAFIASIIGLGIFGEWATKKIAASETASTIAATYRAKKSRICPVVEIAT